MKNRILTIREEALWRDGLLCDSMLVLGVRTPDDAHSPGSTDIPVEDLRRRSAHQEPKRRAISLEQQVRIAAGSLVMLGVLLGLLIHPGFLGISAFVGAGLIFAGITDTCGMAVVLAKMPWNRAPSACKTD